MSLAAQTSSGQGRRDQGPNQDLTNRIIADGDKSAIDELFGLLESAKRPTQFDVIVIINNIAEAKPRLILPHIARLFALLSNKQNRLLWGAISTLYHLTDLAPEQMMEHLNALLEGADRGSVIAKDRIIAMLAKLNRFERFAPIVTPIILQRLSHCAINQTPMYVEFAAPTITAQDWPAFAKIVARRRDEISYPAKKKRLQKILDAGPQI